MTLAAQLEALADRLRRLRPSHRDPESFFIEKSEIEHGLHTLAARVRQKEGAPRCR